MNALDYSVLQKRDLLSALILIAFCGLFFFALSSFAQSNAEDQPVPFSVETALLTEAGWKLRQGDMQGALTAYYKILETSPDNIEAHMQIGYVKNLLGQNNEGEEQLAKAFSLIAKGLEKDPNNARMYYLRSKAKRYSLDYDGAIADTKKAMELDPQRSNYDLDFRLIEWEPDYDSIIREAIKKNNDSSSQ